MGFVANKGTALHVSPACTLVLPSQFSVFHFHIHSALIDKGGIVRNDVKVWYKYSDVWEEMVFSV
jgi:hypothetical protein